METAKQYGSLFEDNRDQNINIANKRRRGDYKQIYDNNRKCILSMIGCICCIGVLLTVILIPVSLKSVEYNEYAIRYDDLTKTIYPDLYLEGKYVFTPETKLFKFSSLVQKMSIELSCLTSNGVNVELYVDIQYQMAKSQVNIISLSIH